MRINATAKVLVLAKNERPGSNNNKFYDVAVFADGQAGNLSCSEEAYEALTEGQVNEVIFQYNTEYKSFRIVGCVQAADPGNDGAQPPGTGKPADNGKPEKAAK